MITFNEEQLAVIATHNANSKLNSFLAANPECEKLVKQDRMDFVMVANNCERELTKLLQEFQGKKCLVTGRFSGTKKGVIEIPLMDTYNGRTFEHSTRIYRDGTIALWVVTDTKTDTHLYDSTEIEIIEDEIPFGVDHPNFDSDESYTGEDY